MELKQSLRYAKTRRYTGRRSLTPMRSKHKSIGKTRGHRVEKKRHVQLLQYTSSQHDGQRQRENEDEHSEHSSGQGNQNSDSEGKWKDTEIHQEAEQIRGSEDSKESVHPGPVQTVFDMFEQEISAGNQTSDKTEIEAEELAPLP